MQWTLMTPAVLQLGRSGEFHLRNGKKVDIIRSIGYAQGAGPGPKARQYEIVADPTPTMDLNSCVNHLQDGVGR